MTTTPTMKHNPPSLLTFPEGEKMTRYGRPSYEAACYGNERIAVLLDYFVYQASLEIDRLLKSEPCSGHGQSCKDESCKSECAKRCKVVNIARSHADILSKLPIHLCRKTLIGYIDKLNTWGYVTSETYGRGYTVNLEAVQKAVSTPPEPEKRMKTGGRKSKGEAHSEESCKVVACESCKVVEMKLSEMEQKVVMLQQNVSFFQLKVSQLQLKVGELQLYNPSSAPSEMRLEGPFESLLSFPVLSDLSCNEEIVGSACATPTPPLAPVLEAQKEDDLTTKETNTDDGLATLSAGHDSRDDSQYRLSGSDQAELGRTPPAAPKGRQQKDPPVKRASRPRAQASPQASSPSRKSPAPAPVAEDEAVLNERCKAIQAKINELRGFALKRAGLIIDERKVIRDHLAKEDFTDERIERIHAWVTTNIWKYKSVGGRGDVGARVIWEESGRAEALTVAPLASRPERPRYNEHGVDMSQYSLSALFAQQQQRQEVGQA